MFKRLTTSGWQLLETKSGFLNVALLEMENNCEVEGERERHGVDYCVHCIVFEERAEDDGIKVVIEGFKDGFDDEKEIEEN